MTSNTQLIKVKAIGTYRADGYYEVGGVKTAFEFHGFLHHGHTSMARDTVYPCNGLTMEELYQKAIEKCQHITGRGYGYIEEWECEFDAEVKLND